MFKSFLEFTHGTAIRYIVIIYNENRMNLITIHGFEDIMSLSLTANSVRPFLITF